MRLGRGVGIYCCSLSSKLEVDSLISRTLIVSSETRIGLHKT